MFGWEFLAYPALDGFRWGVGPVGDGWRDAIGVSVVLAGRGFALFRWPQADREWLAEAGT
jgi:hypothetical protein